MHSLQSADDRPSLPAIKKAYRKAALAKHPDRAHNHENAEEATRAFQAVKDAFDRLSCEAVGD